MLLLLTLVATAQTPRAPGTPANRAAAGDKGTAAGKPAGNLIQVMRGVLFPNANLIFDVQQVDPAAPPKTAGKEDGATTTSTFAHVYSGWQVVENAAVALDESVDTMLKAGRVCENGTPVPVAQADYLKTALGLRTTSREILKAAREKNRDRVNELSEGLSEACAACHQIYRDPEGPKGFGDTSLRCKVLSKTTGQ
jgi:hypothetical protein